MQLSGMRLSGLHCIPKNLNIAISPYRVLQINSQNFSRQKKGVPCKLHIIKNSENICCSGYVSTNIARNSAITKTLPPDQVLLPTGASSSTDVDSNHPRASEYDSTPQ